MKKGILTGLYVLFAITVFGQTKFFNKNNLKLGLTFSPDYCYHFIMSNRYSDTYKLIRSDIEGEVPDFGMTTGISMIYRLDSTISFESGIQFSNNGVKEMESYDIGSYAYDIMLFDLTGEKNSNKHKFRYYYINLPLKVNYNIINKQLKWFVSTGISVNMYITDKVIGMSNKNTNNKVYRDLYLMYRSMIRARYKRELNITFLIGTGIDYSFNNKWNLRIEPIYRQSLLAIKGYSDVRYLYSLGINYGVYYKL